MKKKKIILFLLVFALLIALAACSKSEKSQGSEAADTAVSESLNAENMQKEADLLAEALRLQNEPADDYVIQANDFSMSRALFENRVESVMLSGVSREDAEQNVLNYVVVQTLYHAALNAGVTIDEAQFQQDTASARQQLETAMAEDETAGGSRYELTKVFLDALEANGIKEDYWSLLAEYDRMQVTILQYTRMLHDNNYIGQGYSTDDQAGYLQYCLDVTRGEMEAQNVQFAPDIQWELNGLNYHYYLWPEL